MDPLRELSAETWTANVRNAKQIRKAKLINDQLLDEFDAQDVSELPRIFEQFYSRLASTTGQRGALVQALKDIVEYRNAISHPATSYVSSPDARNAAERIAYASKLVFEPHSDELSAILAAVADVNDAEPPHIIPVNKVLPPRHTVVVNEFVGRFRELDLLYKWFVSSTAVWVIEADGGKGKSSLAYVFADQITSGTEQISRIVWLTAKARRYLEGDVIATEPDFTTLDQALRFIIEAYGFTDAVSSDDDVEDVVLNLLAIEPALIILDDIDSLERENEDVARWFTNTLVQRTASKVLLTSRRSLFGYGAYTTALSGLSLSETTEYLAAVSLRRYGNGDGFTAGNHRRLIHTATDGSPLYLDDIVRLILATGDPIETVVKEWRERGGEAAREYALRREFDMLSSLAKDVLLASALRNERITRAELMAALHCRPDDLTAAITQLHRFYLISYPDQTSETPTFEVNQNLATLVKQAMKGDASFKRIANALKQLTSGGRLRKLAPDAMLAIRDAVALVKLDRHGEAEQLLRTALEAHPNEAALLSHLGWVLSRAPGKARLSEAVEYMERSVRLKHRNRATYVNLSTIYLGQDEHDKAAAVVSAGLDIYGDDHEFLYLLAIALAGRSLALFKTVEAIAPQSVPVLAEPARKALAAINDALSRQDAVGPAQGHRLVILRRDIEKNLRAVAEAFSTPT